MSTPIIVSESPRGHGCLVTLLWFVFVGWWASLAVLGVAWLLIVLVVTMPIGLALLNQLPKVASLREPSTELVATTDGLVTRVQRRDLPQRSFLLRTVYFVLVGWWLSFFWAAFAWLASLTLVGLPLAIYMYGRVPAVTTLRRY